LIPAPFPELFAPAAIAWLQQLELDPPGREALDRHLRQLSALEKEIYDQGAELAAIANGSGPAKLLMTLPGVDFPVALTLLAVLGDITRFPSADKAAAYLGLVPSTRQSGGHCYHGRITKQGSAHGRWMLVQAAQSLATHPGPLGVFFRRLAKKKNRNVAVVATARKLVTIAWRMLRHNEPYRYARPATLSAKFSRLRIRATGQRNKGGVAKGAPRAEAYGTGKRTRAVPSLDAVYSEAGVPPVRPLSAGERHMVSQSGVADFVEAIRKPARKPRAVSK
jgi:transposase